MKEDYTHISICLDRSGSMDSMKNEVISGFNDFIKKQKKIKGKATLTMAQFDDCYDVVYDMKQLTDVNDLNSLSFQPRGSTALLDAMGKIITDVRSNIKAMKEENKPNKVIFVFITDGQENASNKYKRKDIFEMIQDQRTEDNWEFVFIGANQDAIQEGQEYGIRAKSSLTFAASGEGATKAFDSLSEGMTFYRCCTSSAAEYSFTEKDIKNQEELLSSK